MKRNKIVHLICCGAISLTVFMAACERLASTPPIPSETPDLLNVISTKVNITTTPGVLTTATTSTTPAATDSAITTTVPTDLPQDGSVTPDAEKIKPTTKTTATLVAKTPVPTTQPTSNNSPYMGQHTVASGETLYMIGRAYGVYPPAIADTNHISDPNSITPGMVLNIPKVRWPGGVPQGPTTKQQFEPNF